jgi:hypothetical protein
MHWDYRVVKYTVRGVWHRRLRRVEYKDAAREVVKFIDEFAPEVQGKTHKDMLLVMETMLDAYDKSHLYHPDWNVE